AVTSNDELPPLVVLLAPPATGPRAGRPRPGLIEAVLWCLLFLLTQIMATLAVGAAIMFVYAWGREQPWTFVEEQLAGLTQLTRQSPPAAESPLVSNPDNNETPAERGAELPQSTSAPRAIVLALVYGMLAAQLAAWGLIHRVLPRLMGPDWRVQIGWRRPRLAQMLLIAILLPPFMLLAGGLHESIQQWLGGKSANVAGLVRAVFSQAPLLVTLAATAIGPGIVEEVWCRGFLGRGLIARYGWGAGIFWTSLLFGFLHLDPAYALAAAAMGAYLHFVYLACRSIFASILLHTLNNAVAVLATLYPLGLDNLAADGASLNWSGYALAAMTLVGCSYVLWRMRPAPP
ncbi:MAG: CPBP family intramembrane metalloprotease, partial [Gemmataceae bacterium]|nr:CPBP family intramembrane metalloprotease [Gemmataceae bacterium]